MEELLKESLEELLMESHEELLIKPREEFQVNEFLMELLVKSLDKVLTKFLE